MSVTRKESQKQIDLYQMKTDMDVLIKSINAKSEYDIAICPVGTNPPRFEISVEYPRYNKGEGAHKFQRYISIREAEEIARNIFHNIDNLHGHGYKENCFELHEYDGEIMRNVINLDSDYEYNILRKKIHIHISFKINHNE